MNIPEKKNDPSSAPTEDRAAPDPIKPAKTIQKPSVSDKQQQAFQKKLLQHCLRPLHELMSSHAAGNYLNRHLIHSLVNHTIESTQSIVHLLSGTAQEKSYRRYLDAVDTFITTSTRSSDTVIDDLNQLEKLYRSLIGKNNSRFFSRPKTSLFSQQRASMMTLISDYHAQMAAEETSEQPSFVTTIINPLLRSCMVVAIHLEEWFSSLMVCGVFLY